MKTVFILGAGASVPYGFPTGEGLRREILDAIESELTVHTIVSKNRGIDLNQRFRESGLSIDKFTEVFSQHSTNPDQVLQFARLGIGWRLTEAEMNSDFNERSPNSSEDWYRPFFQRLFDDVRTKDEFFEVCSDLTFITFNYDRSLEYYVLQQMNAVFNDPMKINMDFIDEELPFKVIHIYGSLGTFDQLKYRSVKKPSSGYLGNFNLIGDRNRSDQTEEVLEYFKAANRIFFLGFSFQKDNMKSLGFVDNSRFVSIGKKNSTGGITFGPEIVASVFGTALGYSEVKTQQINSMLFNGIAKLFPIGCRTLIESYY